MAIKHMQFRESTLWGPSLNLKPLAVAIILHITLGRSMYRGHTMEELSMR